MATRARSLPVQRRWATYVFEVRTGQRLAVLPGHPDEHHPRVHCTPDGSVRVASVTKNQGRTLEVRSWDLPTGWPPAWLSVVTAVGLLLVIADRRRGRPCGNYSIQMT